MFNIISRPPIYDQDAVQPMRDELIAVGFSELKSQEDVDKAINVNDDKTVLVMINSVCGCAAGSARPGVSLALQHSVRKEMLLIKSDNISETFRRLHPALHYLKTESYYILCRDMKLKVKMRNTLLKN